VKLLGDHRHVLAATVDVERAAAAVASLAR
jgi:hypothetical protein